MLPTTLFKSLYKNSPYLVGSFATSETLISIMGKIISVYAKIKSKSLRVTLKPELFNLSILKF